MKDFNQRERDYAVDAQIRRIAPDETDDRIALAFSGKHADTLRYVSAWGKWFRWTGRVWKEDSTLAVYDAVREYCREVMETRKPKPNIIHGIQQFVRADRRQAATIEQWDTDLWLLNTPAGVIDLKTGELGKHDSALHMTKIAAIAPGGDCPRWRQFLGEVTNYDTALIDFLQRLAGYSLTGSVREHAFAFLYGTGSNGKGVFLNTLTGVMGDYATVSPMETFTESYGERHTADLAMLRGARLVVAQETDEGKRWAESRIKTLTGGDPISARFMRQNFFTYVPQFTLLIAGNHKPQLRNVDEAMRRRLHLVPFTVTIPPEDRDAELADKLRAEWPGVLAWMVEGCVGYCREGLDPPERVTAATAEYFEAQDAFGQWIETCCDVGPTYWEPPGRLFQSWKKFAEEANERAGGSKTFGDRLEQAGYPRARVASTRMHEGLRLKMEEATWPK